MIRHIMKTLWNRKREYYGIFAEQILVTVILMLSAVSISETVKKYKTPGLLDVDNTFTVGYMLGANATPELMNSTAQSMNTVIENLRKLPYVKAVSRGYNIVPYVKDDNVYARDSDSVRIDGNGFKAVIKYSDEYGASVFNPEMEEGAWLENRALPDGSAPAVITRQFASKAGWTKATGKKLTLKSMPQPYTVVGVVSGLKQEPFIPSPAAIVIPRYSLKPESGAMFSENTVKIKAGMENEFSEAYRREFTRLISDENVELFMMNIQSLKGSYMTNTLLYIVLQAVPTLFLVIFAFIGTFGLYWMVSRKRMKEYALRIALGSTKNRLMLIVIGESVLITSLSVIPALALSFFLYIYDAVHIIAVGSTILTMLIFAVISAWYPAWMVSKVNPSESLKYE